MQWIISFKQHTLILEISIFKHLYIFRHLKLEIALAIPVYNEHVHVKAIFDHFDLEFVCCFIYELAVNSI